MEVDTLASPSLCVDSAIETLMSAWQTTVDDIRATRFKKRYCSKEQCDIQGVFSQFNNVELKFPAKFGDLNTEGKPAAQCVFSQQDLRLAYKPSLQTICHKPQIASTVSTPSKSRKPTAFKSKKRTSLVLKSRIVTVPQYKLTECGDESDKSDPDEWARRKKQVQEALGKAIQAMFLKKIATQKLGANTLRAGVTFDTIGKPINVRPLRADQMPTLSPTAQYRIIGNTKIKSLNKDQITFSPQPPPKSKDVHPCAVFHSHDTIRSDTLSEGVTLTAGHITLRASKPAPQSRPTPLRQQTLVTAMSDSGDLKVSVPQPSEPHRAIRGTDLVSKDKIRHFNNQSHTLVERTLKTKSSNILNSLVVSSAVLKRSRLKSAVLFGQKRDKIHTSFEATTAQSSKHQHFNQLIRKYGAGAGEVDAIVRSSHQHLRSGTLLAQSSRPQTQQSSRVRTSRLLKFTHKF